MFEPGQRVACVDGKFPPDIRDYFNALPVEGHTYTVRDVVPGMMWNGQEFAGVYLAELKNLPNEHGIEPGFHPSRFRELDELTDHLQESEPELVEAGADLVEVGT